MELNDHQGLNLNFNYFSLDSRYSIVAPDSVRAFSPYTVAASIHGDAPRTTILVSITDGAGYVKSSKVTVQADRTQLVVLYIENLDLKKTYKLIVEGTCGLIFKHENNLNVIPDNDLVFIQTDKPIYKPGDTVRYRILLLDIQTLPKKGKMTILVIVS